MNSIFSKVMSFWVTRMPLPLPGDWVALSLGLVAPTPRMVSFLVMVEKSLV